MTTPTILFQPPNHVGLGHINRLSAIALALRQIDPEIRAPFAVEGAAHVLLDALDLPYVPLPSTHLMQENKYWSSWTEGERAGLSVSVARAVLASVDPQLVVFDCFPNQGFLSAVLERQVPMALCIREMRNLDKYLEEVSDLLPRVSLILVPHDAGTFDLPEALNAKSRFVGRVMKPVKLIQKEEKRNPNCLRVVVSGGGGGYPGTFKFYNLAMRAVSELRQSYPKLEARTVVGPLFRDWSLLEPMNGISMIPFDPDPFATFASADLVISVAGYNTVTELQCVGTRTILLPAERLWDDQFSRAERTARMYPHFRIFRGSSHMDLANVARGFLTEPVPTARMSVPDGGSKAAWCLRSMIKKHLRLAERQPNQ